MRQEDSRSEGGKPVPILRNVKVGLVGESPAFRGSAHLWDGHIGGDVCVDSCSPSRNVPVAGDLMRVGCHEVARQQQNED